MTFASSLCTVYTLEEFQKLLSDFFSIDILYSLYYNLLLITNLTWIQTTGLGPHAHNWRICYFSQVHIFWVAFSEYMNFTRTGCNTYCHTLLKSGLKKYKPQFIMARVSTLDHGQSLLPWFDILYNFSLANWCLKKYDFRTGPEWIFANTFTVQTLTTYTIATSRGQRPSFAPYTYLSICFPNK